MYRCPLTLKSKLTIIAVALVTVGCGTGGKPTTGATTSTTSSGANTAANTAAPATTRATPATTRATPATTVAPSPSAVKGTDDASVATRLYNVANAEDTLYLDAGKFTDDLAMLTDLDPSVTYGSGLTPPPNPATVNVAISADAQWACFIGRSAVGHLLVEAIGPPPGNEYTGNVALTICDTSSVQKMRRASG